MVKDENVCLHCGLCAERCPTYAWDMRKFVVEIPVRGNGIYSSGSGRALRSRLRSETYDRS